MEIVENLKTERIRGEFKEIGFSIPAAKDIQGSDLKVLALDLIADAIVVSMGRSDRDDHAINPRRILVEGFEARDLLVAYLEKQQAAHQATLC